MTISLEEGLRPSKTPLIITPEQGESKRGEASLTKPIPPLLTKYQGEGDIGGEVDR